MEVAGSECNDVQKEDSSESVEIKAIIQNPGGSQVYRAKDNTEWHADPQPTGRPRAESITKSSLNKVILPPGRTLKEPLDAFNLYITDEIVDRIVKCTNKEAETTYANLKKNEKWKDCDATEIRAFLGLVLTSGHLKQHLTSCEVLWDPIYGPPIFRATMGLCRFKSLCRFLRFDLKETRSNRRKKDKLAPIRDVWDEINKNLKKYYLPGVNITVDEQIIPFRGRCSFRQYIPSKPDKYGLKIWWLCDSENAYPLNGFPCLGKEGSKGLFKLESTVVEKLIEPYIGSKRNITCVSYFTDFQLANSLLSKGLTLVGTVRKSKPFIPAPFLPHKSRPIKSYLFGFTNNCTLVSYVPEQSKSVILLSTMHHTNEIDASGTPEIITYYNQTKGGVHLLDQLVHEYISKRKTNRWPVIFFLNSVDCAGVAASIIWKSTYPEWNRRNNSRRVFLEQVAEGLVKPNIERRKIGLQKPLAKVIQDFKEITYDINLPGPSSEPPAKKRCFACPSKIGRMQKQTCKICKLHICKEHSFVVCNKCCN